MRKLLLVIVWLPLATTSLVVSLFLLHSYTEVREGTALLSMQARKMALYNGYQFYAALPQVLGSFSVALAKEDARGEMVRQFLHKYQSPLEEYADVMISEADKHAIDFRMIPAISGCESTFGRHMPAGSYNAFGYAIYTGQVSGAVFDNWEHAKGLTTPHEIGPIYAPPSVATGDSWAICVSGFMDEMK